MEFLSFTGFHCFETIRYRKQKVSSWKSQKYVLFWREISKMDTLFGRKLETEHPVWEEDSNK